MLQNCNCGISTVFCTAKAERRCEEDASSSSSSSSSSSPKMI